VHGPLLTLVLPMPAPNRCKAGPAVGTEGTGKSLQTPATPALIAARPKLSDISLAAL